ncbi:hypothetical protein SGLAM104S_03647 [Streptomyces glaucescens]
MLALRDDGPAAEAKAPSSRADRERLSAEDTAQRTARKTGKKVEVTSLTDEFSKTHANPDGTFTYTVSAQPVRARNDKGTWAPIDTSLRRHGDGWRTVNSLYPVTFSGGGGNNARAMGGRSPVTPAAHRAAETAADWSPLLTMNAEAHTIEVEWPGALPEPAIDGDRALYEGVRPGVDLLLTARDTGFTHVLVVHTPEAAAALAQDPPRYRVTSPTLRFSLDPLTDVLTGRDGEGREIAVAPTPFLWDSAGTHDSDAAATGPEAAPGTNEDPETVEEAPARPEAAPRGGQPRGAPPRCRRARRGRARRLLPVRRLRHLRPARPARPRRRRARHHRPGLAGRRRRADDQPAGQLPARRRDPDVPAVPGPAHRRHPRQLDHGVQEVPVVQLLRRRQLQPGHQGGPRRLRAGHLGHRPLVLPLRPPALHQERGRLQRHP